ncbi:MFS transporter [Actinotalea sp. M2MS4P-6]|uniref:MFS transporter n=1 Tax=Actinotalea sp. M2MS4P-6 TaxID=2983762 RepID=UPI0021E41E29|nr:MFS transporter [Actinotalea sp. M2MS4P-6]MCV2392957.1 MFS transporter [Actinotalea sp. M2MS4P-6]
MSSEHPLNGYRLYGYRWVVLAVFMLVNVTIQILWISYAPITGPAAEFYGVSDLQIGLLAMTFMIAFIPLSIPASWVIDTYGFRVGVGIGVALMGVFGLLRGFAGDSYGLVLGATIGVAVAQPFLLNAWTTVPAKWFPVGGRATAVGLVTLANLVGTALGMVLTPVLIESMSIPTVQLIYGAVAAASSVAFLALARERPPTPPGESGSEVRALALEGLRHALTVKPFLLMLGVALIGLGIFNGINTWIENIIRPRGFTPTDAGALGAVMILGGLVGAVVIPALSDRQHKRQRYLMIAVVGAIPGLLGLTFATSPALLYGSAFVLGFFLVSALPVGMQYAAEVTYPTPEATSNGLIQLFGQGAVVFVYVMEAMRSADGSFTPSLLLAAGLLVVSAGLVTRMPDPDEVRERVPAG